MLCDWVAYGLDEGIPRLGIPHESFSRPGMYVGLRVKCVLIDFDRTGTVLNEFYKTLWTLFFSLSLYRTATLYLSGLWDM